MKIKQSKIPKNQIISIDVGGTYCDAITIHQKKVHSVKILSSGVIRAKVIKVKENVLELASPLTIPFPQALLNCPIWVAGKVVGKVTEYLALNHEIIVNKNLKNLTIDIIELNPKLEAPVFAAHLLSGIPIAKKLKTIELRIGSTKSTNALLEGKGTKGVFITNEGLEDLLYIKNQQRPHIFQLNIPEPNLFYKQVIGVKARMNATGKVLSDLNSVDLKKIISNLPRDKTLPIAIALMHSYKNPVHEIKIAQFLKSQGFKNISLSHQIQPTLHLVPRAESTVINAYLTNVLKSFIHNIKKQSQLKEVFFFSSSGQLVKDEKYKPIESLLSGPAGGIKACEFIGKEYGISKIISFDVGGTSTDTACFEKRAELKFETKIKDLNLATASYQINTIAAGGGSIIKLEKGRYSVGPESAGNHPGPACYGKGGPFTLTDLHLLQGNISTENFNIPIDVDLAQKAFLLLINKAEIDKKKQEEILEGILHIANENMAEAIRKISTNHGFAPQEHTLIAYGGGGGLHACAIAEMLDIKRIIIPFHSGILSATGIQKANQETLQVLQINKPLAECAIPMSKWWSNLEKKARKELNSLNAVNTVKKVYLRYSGQNHSILVDWNGYKNLKKLFIRKYKSIHGYALSQSIELEKITLSISLQSNKIKQRAVKEKSKTKIPHSKYIDWTLLSSCDIINNACTIYHTQGTVSLQNGWKATVLANKDLDLEKVTADLIPSKKFTKEVEQELAINRLKSIAEEMGVMLQQNAISVNVKERLDFSCAILNAKAQLVVNAPHIPVHLGSLGICARLILKEFSLKKGDILLCNHPLYGGSHLPDLTLIKGVYSQSNQLLGYVINRAHHAEIGGLTPGSMPPHATNLVEEGVCFSPTYLCSRGKFQWNKIESLLISAPYPSRNFALNILDLHAAVRSLELGETRLLKLVEKYGKEYLRKNMEKILAIGANEIKSYIAFNTSKKFIAEEKMDDGRKIKCDIKITSDNLHFDFAGTSTNLFGNLNANKAITTSAILYVLRLLSIKEIVLNEGLMKNVTINLPPCFLNPLFDKDPKLCPPVVGGNTEVSQRLTDCLIKTFGLAACSQGTMNNFLFGDNDLSYYETIGGGAGATPKQKGRSAVHQHMTNTKITDPEELELKYPVQLEKFSIRKNSGGKGKYEGGDGIERRIKFLKPMTITIIGQHRKQAPYGLKGGLNGAYGEQWHISKNKKIRVTNDESISIQKNDSILIKTPGGGAWGKKKT